MIEIDSLNSFVVLNTNRPNLNRDFLIHSTKKQSNDLTTAKNVTIAVITIVPIDKTIKFFVQNNAEPISLCVPDYK